MTKSSCMCPSSRRQVRSSRGDVAGVRGRGHLLSAGRARREGRWRRAGRRLVVAVIRRCGCRGQLVRQGHERRFRAVAARRAWLLHDRRTVFRRGRRAEPPAVFVSDDSDRVGDHHRTRHTRDACARLRAVADLCGRHGAGLHGARHRRGAGGPEPRRVATEPVGARRVRRAVDRVCRLADLGQDIALPARWQNGAAEASTARQAVISSRSRRWARCPHWLSAHA